MGAYSGIEAVCRLNAGSLQIIRERNFAFSGEDYVGKKCYGQRGYEIRNNWLIGSATSKKQVFENSRSCCCRVNQNNGRVKRATDTCHKMFIYDLTRFHLTAFVTYRF